MYSRDIRIEFNHCDPAGIVFFARYFEILNSQVENFFRDVLDYPWEKLMFADRQGVPTVRFEIEFRNPSKLGDLLRFDLSVETLGRSSLDLTHAATGPDATTRLSARQRLVWVARDGRSMPWPDYLRAELAAHLEEQP
ncbi:thioesterase family protein [Pararhodobacter sp. SW119]|uniref:acyl-CoA thioesterase n=1 Tax=Pararhodobacter sp. SW119 TaxID=2780075 RepID=UPI001ADFFDD5|nr:thioesterase family protein [Pararhodobacter sp. SW119]